MPARRAMVRAGTSWAASNSWTGTSRWPRSMSSSAMVCSAGGLDERAAVDAAFAACHAALRPGGLLLVVWSDTRRRQGRALMQAPALTRFAPLPCAPLGASVVRTGSANHYVFSFFVRPE
jgi:hypothetical protein